MITLTGAVSASSAALAGLQQAMQGAGHSIVALSSGEVPVAGSASSTGAVSTPDAANQAADSTVGKLLNEQA